jgi:general secretion pathway protein K
MKEKGAVLILVLVVIAFLSVLVLEFGHLMRLDAVMAGNHANSTKAFYLARSGVSLALVLVDKKDGPEYEEWIKDLPDFPITMSLGDGEVSFTIIDEQSKINMNHLLRADGSLNRRQVELLFNLFDILNRQYEKPIFSYAMVPAMVDWIDRDDEVTVFDFIIIGENEGAESEYYEDLDPPYKTKNAPFDTFRELLKVRGINEKVLYGEKRAEGETTYGLSEYVTVYGDGKININTASSMVLQALDREIDEVLAQNIIYHRQEDEFKRITDIRNVEGITEEIFTRIKDLITTDKGQFFSVRSKGTVGKITEEVKVVIQKKPEGPEIIYWRFLENPEIFDYTPACGRQG